MSENTNFCAHSKALFIYHSLYLTQAPHEHIYKTEKTANYNNCMYWQLVRSSVFLSLLFFTGASNNNKKRWLWCEQSLSCCSDEFQHIFRCGALVYSNFLFHSSLQPSVSLQQNTRFQYRSECVLSLHMTCFLAFDSLLFFHFVVRCFDIWRKMKTKTIV